MERYHRYYIRHKEGQYVKVEWDGATGVIWYPAKGIKDGISFLSEEDANNYFSGYYKPKHPEDYYIQTVEITYQEVVYEQS